MAASVLTLLGFSSAIIWCFLDIKNMQVSAVPLSQTEGNGTEPQPSVNLRYSHKEFYIQDTTKKKTDNVHIHVKEPKLSGLYKPDMSDKYKIIFTATTSVKARDHEPGNSADNKHKRTKRSGGFFTDLSHMWENYGNSGDTSSKRPLKTLKTVTLPKEDVKSGKLSGNYLKDGIEVKESTNNLFSENNTNTGGKYNTYVGNYTGGRRIEKKVPQYSSDNVPSKLNIHHSQQDTSIQAVSTPKRKTQSSRLYKNSQGNVNKIRQIEQNITAVSQQSQPYQTLPVKQRQKTYKSYHDKVNTGNLMEVDAYRADHSRENKKPVSVPRSEYELGDAQSQVKPQDKTYESGDSLKDSGLGQKTVVLPAGYRITGIEPIKDTAPVQNTPNYNSHVGQNEPMRSRLRPLNTKNRLDMMFPKKTAVEPPGPPSAPHVYRTSKYGVPKQVAGFWKDTPNPDQEGPTDTEKALLENLPVNAHSLFQPWKSKVSSQWDLKKVENNPMRSNQWDLYGRNRQASLSSGGPYSSSHADGQQPGRGQWEDQQEAGRGFKGYKSPFDLFQDRQIYAKYKKPVGRGETWNSDRDDVIPRSQISKVNNIEALESPFGNEANVKREGEEELDGKNRGMIQNASFAAGKKNGWFSRMQKEQLARYEGYGRKQNISALTSQRRTPGYKVPHESVTVSRPAKSPAEGGQIRERQQKPKRNSRKSDTQKTSNRIDKGIKSSEKSEGQTKSAGVLSLLHSNPDTQEKYNDEIPMPPKSHAWMAAHKLKTSIPFKEVTTSKVKGSILRTTKVPFGQLGATRSDSGRQVLGELEKGVIESVKDDSLPMPPKSKTWLAEHQNGRINQGVYNPEILKDSNQGIKGEVITIPTESGTSTKKEKNNLTKFNTRFTNNTQLSSKSNSEESGKNSITNLAAMWNTSHTQERQKKRQKRNIKFDGEVRSISGLKMNLREDYLNRQVGQSNEARQSEEQHRHFQSMPRYRKVEAESEKINDFGKNGAVLIDGEPIPMPPKSDNKNRAMIKSRYNYIPKKEYHTKKIGVPQKVAGFWKDTPDSDERDIIADKKAFSLGRSSSQSYRVPVSSKSETKVLDIKSPESKHIRPRGQRLADVLREGLKPSGGPQDAMVDQKHFNLDHIKPDNDKTLEKLDSTIETPKKWPTSNYIPPRESHPAGPKNQNSNVNLSKPNLSLSVLHNVPEPKTQRASEKLVLKGQNKIFTQTGGIRGINKVLKPFNRKINGNVPSKLADILQEGLRPRTDPTGGHRSRVDQGEAKPSVPSESKQVLRAKVQGNVSLDGNGTVSNMGFRVLDPKFYSDFIRRHKSADSFWAMLTLSVILFVMFAAVWHSKMWKKKYGDWQLTEKYMPAPSVSLRELLKEKLAKMPRLKLSRKRKRKIGSKIKRTGKYTQLKQEETNLSSSSTEEEGPDKKL